VRGSHGVRLARRLADYVAHTRDHMRSEEAVFYAHSERVLTDADWAMLLSESTPDDPMGNQAQLAKEYPHLAAQLFQHVSDVGGRGDIARTGGGAPDGAGDVIHDGVEQLFELWGELIHDGVEVGRSNVAALRSVRSPWGLLRAAGPLGARSLQFVARCVADPPRLALATVARFLAAWRAGGAGADAEGGAPPR
jgi:hypothetical protein